MLTKELQETLSATVDEAVRRRHEYVTLEHLLFALTNDKTASHALRHCGCNIERLRRDLETFFTEI